MSGKHSEFAIMARYAILNGATRTGGGSITWDLAGNCQSPVPVTVKYPSRDNGQSNRWIDYWTRCRKCPPCRKQRARQWAARMRAEIASADRSWLVTLTLAPDRQVWADYAAQSRLLKRGVRMDELSPSRQHAERVNSIGPEITRYFKRVRKMSGAKLRYALVAEAHKTGAPHFHAVIHEVDHETPVRHRHITGSWWWGFSHAKLIPADDKGKASNYVAKYLNKDSSARLRASRGYGQPQDPDPSGLKRATSEAREQRAKVPAGNVHIVDPNEVSVTAKTFATSENALAWCSNFIASLNEVGLNNELSGCSLSRGLSKRTDATALVSTGAITVTISEAPKASETTQQTAPRTAAQTAARLRATYAEQSDPLREKSGPEGGRYRRTRFP